MRSSSKPGILFTISNTSSKHTLFISVNASAILPTFVAMALIISIVTSSSRLLLEGCSECDDDEGLALVCWDDSWSSSPTSCFVYIFIDQHMRWDPHEVFVALYRIRHDFRTSFSPISIWLLMANYNMQLIEVLNSFFSRKCFASFSELKHSRRNKK